MDLAHVADQSQQAGTHEDPPGLFRLQLTSQAKTARHHTVMYRATPVYQIAKGVKVYHTSTFGDEGACNSRWRAYSDEINEL